MTDASAISDKIGEPNVVAFHGDETYYVVGVADVSDLPIVGGFEPIADPAETN